jgi:transketolase
MSSFGESGPYKDVYKYFGITSDDICDKIQLQLNFKTREEDNEGSN